MKNFNMILEYVPNFNYFPMPLFTNVKYNETAALARLRRIYRYESIYESSTVRRVSTDWSIYMLPRK